ncbi:MAG: hypothetical protein U0528_08350 [Anaerolineae bacterium]|nr:hypothetical protein [Anaerolineae bacterium]
MNFQANPDNLFAEAIAMYRRLRERGQNGTLARISVEARFSSFTPAQRQQLRQLFARTELNN